MLIFMESMVQEPRSLKIWVYKHYQLQDIHFI